MATQMMMNTDNAYLVLTREAPATQAGLEFFKNALEAIGSTKLSVSSIKIGKGFKAVFTNDGEGMDEETMFDLAKVFETAKAKNGKTDENYNTGARLIGMKTNENGVVFVSQHNGIVRSTRVFLEDGVALAEFNEEKFTKMFPKQRKDWVKVVLLGNSVGQNTLTKPYGNSSSNSPFLEQFLFRFYKLNKPFRVDLNGGILVPLSKQYEKALYSKSVKVNKDVTIHYRVTPTKMKAVCGVLVTNSLGLQELFDVHYNAGSSKFAKSSMRLLGELGAYAMKTELSVIVELSRDFDVKQTQYRDALQNKAGQPVELVDFYKQITDYVPTDLRVLIDEKANRVNDKELKTKTTEVVKEMMDELGLDLEKMVANKTGSLTADVKNPSKNKTDAKQKDPKPSEGKDKPTPAEKEKGVPTLTAEFFEQEWEKHDLGVIRGTRVYFNRENPFVKHAIKGVKQKDPRQNSGEIATKYVEFLASSVILALAYYQDEDNEDLSKAVILTVASVIQGSGSFVESYLKNLKKG